MTAAEIEFRLLGSLEASRNGERIPLGGPKQRRLLALLLVNPNEPVSIDRLIDAVWGDYPPARAEHALEVHVSRLRKAVGTALLLREGSGYLARVEPGQLDVDRFQALVARGRDAFRVGDPEAASRDLREALSLWRGPALADFLYEHFAQAEIVQLEELRLAAYEERIEADLALGHHAELVGELEGLVAQHPLHERFCAQLMLALYRSGRQAEALAAYQEARRVLVEELGIEPSPALQRLERGILRQEPELELPERKEKPLAPTPQVRKTVTLVFSDASGSAAPGQTLDPEVLHRRAAEHFEAAAVVFTRHGGTPRRSPTDEVMGVFGIPAVHEDDALRAVRAALELREAADAIRIGVSTGEVIVEDPTSSEALVAGEPVGLASRLHQSASPGEILIDEATRRLLRDAVRVVRAEGSAWRLLELLPEAPPLTGRCEAPMVGRDAELDRLRDVFERAVRDRAPFLFTVLGEPGIGKSRLARELVTELADAATVLVGRCVSYGEGITFWPLKEVVRQAAGEEARERILELLAGEEDAERIADRIAAAIGAGEATAGSEETFWAFRKLFEALSRRRPLLVVFEDIHWAEPTLLDLVEHLAEWAQDAQILFLCLARMELLDERPSWGGDRPGAASIVLEPLPDSDIQLLIDALTGEAALPTGARARVIELAEGNPLFVEQLLAMLAEERPGHEFPVPLTTQALLAARLDRLGPGERAVAVRASIIGHAFWLEGVVELLPEDARSSAARHVQSLVRKRLVRPRSSPVRSEEDFRFAHVLIQDAAYRTIPKELRAELHERFGTWLEQRAGERIAAYEEIVGYHLERAYGYRSELGPVGEPERALAAHAAERLAAAGRRAFMREDMPATVNLLQRAVSLLPTDDPTRRHLLLALGRALMETGDFTEASAVLTEAVERASATGDVLVQAHAMIERAYVLLEAGSIESAEDALREAEEAIDRFAEVDDERGLARAWRFVAALHSHRGRLAAEREAAERALAHARRVGDEETVGESLHYICWGLVHDSSPLDQALRAVEDFLASSTGNPLREADALGPLLGIRIMQARFDEAREIVARLRAILEEVGHRVGLVGVALAAGLLELHAGDVAAAEREFRFGYETSRAMGANDRLIAHAAELAHVLYEQGRDAEADRFAVITKDTAPEHHVTAQVRWRGARAKVLARQGQVVEAEGLAREAVALAETTEIVWLRGSALMDHAEVLRLDDRCAEAVSVVERALRLYERKGHVPMSGRARRVLAELAARHERVRNGSRQRSGPRLRRR